MNLLETTKLVKSYTGRVVVDHVSFVIAQREIVGLLGRNGAGKTTTFRMILGMIMPDSGSVAFDAQDITDLPMYKRALRGIGYLPQEQSIFRQLRVEENLLAILETQNFNRRERLKQAQQLLDQFGLTKVRKQKAIFCSGGEKRKLEIARALVTKPKLILLDEPFSAVDPIAVEDLQREVKRLRDEFGKSVLITDHNVDETLSITDRAYLMVEGKLFRAGSAEELANDPMVRKVYLGQNFQLRRAPVAPSS